MKNSIIKIAILYCIFSACNKGIEFDDQYIRGRVFLTDTITGLKIDVPVKNKSVFLSTGDTLNYLYSTKTDFEGYFVFNLLSDTNNNFTIFANDTIGSLHYNGIVKTIRGEKDVVLQLNLNSKIQNGIILHSRDPNNTIIPSVSYKIYNNPTLALANTGSGFIAIEADNSGKAYNLNLPAGEYWVNAEKTIEPFYYQRIGKKITVNRSGFIIDTIMLFKKDSINGLNLTLIESGNKPVASAEVRIYNNLALAQIDDPNTTIEKFISGSDGKIVRFNLGTGTYFLNAYKIMENDTLRRIAKPITVTARSVITDTMLLHRSSALINGFLLQSKDNLGGIIPFSTLYLYNSELLAMQNPVNGSGSILTITTDNFGYGYQNNLLAGDYYVNARNQVDTVLYQRIAKKITINTKGIFSDTIQLRKF